jgi:hypothetical protein
MAIFRCVGCFYFHIPEGICLAGFTCMWLRKHMQETAKLTRKTEQKKTNRNVQRNPLNNTVQQDAKI